MGVVLLGIELGLCIINIILHGIGLMLLISVKSRPGSISTTQRIYIFNLSLSEFIMNALEVVRIITQLIPQKNLPTVQALYNYVGIIQLTGDAWVYYLAMIYLTADRFLEIYLNITYPIYFSNKRARTLCTCTWIFASASCITFALLHHFLKFDYLNLFYKYIYPTVEFAFLIIATGTYAYIFYKFHQSQTPANKRHLPASNNNTRTNNGSVTSTKRQSRKGIRFSIASIASVDRKKLKSGIVTLFKRSRFWVATLLIITFILFMVVPDMVYLFEAIIGGNDSVVLATTVWIIYIVAMMSDAIVYIFLSPPLRCELFKKLGLRRYLHKPERSCSSKYSAEKEAAEVTAKHTLENSRASSYNSVCTITQNE